MISVIVCSVDAAILNAFERSLHATIGVEHELIAIDNSKNQRGICEAYNIGAMKAKYPFVCFVHEDVAFITNDWGVNAIAHFHNKTNVGVIGLAGSLYKTRMLSSWWQPEINQVEPKRVNLVQHYKFRQQGKEHLVVNPTKEISSIVASLDGVFLFTKKEIWQKQPFDEKRLKGFHGYDMDFTLGIGRNFDNYVVFDILVEHFSEGSADVSWIRENYIVHRKFRKMLPIIKCGNIQPEELWVADNYWLDFSLRTLNFYSRKQFEITNWFMRLLFLCGWNRFTYSYLKRLIMVLSPNNFLLKGLFRVRHYVRGKGHSD